MASVRFAFLSLFCLLASPVVADDCSMARAVYTPIEDEGFGSIENYELFHVRKTIAVNQSQWALTIRAPAGGPVGKMRSYDFGFSFTNGYGGTYLGFSGETAKSEKYEPPRGSDPEGVPGSRIIYFDDGLKTVEAAASTEADPKAPTYLLMPDIGRRFWYWQGSDRAFVPPGTMWKRTSCRDK
jgi:hypothetical protein